MKKLMLAFFLLFGGIAVMAQDTTGVANEYSRDQGQVANQDEEQGREPIETRDLPAAVRASLEGQDYQGWTISTAYRARKTDPSEPSATEKEIYIVDLRNGAQTKTVKFDAQGNKIDHKDHDKDHDQR